MVSERRLRICLSIYMFKPCTGGLQGHAEQLCRHLARRGHEVVLITRAFTRMPHFRDYLFFNEPEGEYIVNGVVVRPLRFSPAWRPVQWFLSKCVPRPPLAPLGVWLYGLQASRRAKQAFANFDIVHHIGQSTALIGFAAARAAKHWGVPFVVQPTCHPHVIGDSTLDLRLYTQADRLMVHTQYEEDHLRAKGMHCPIDVVGNGIEDGVTGCDDRFRRRFGITGPLVLFLGRKDSDKGYPLLLEAFRQVRRERTDVTLVCMGPPGRPAAESSVEGVLDLEFAPEETKHDALAACTCLCVPSEGESFGLVYMEAGRYAKPVVARRLPVLRELLEDGGAGLLLGRSDDSRNWVALDADELAVGLLGLLSNPAQCRRLGDNCRRVSEQFVWPRVVTRFEEAYRKALSEKSWHMS